VHSTIGWVEVDYVVLWTLSSSPADSPALSHDDSLEIFFILTSIVFLIFLVIVVFDDLNLPGWIG
jgi:hypothetical protein